MSSRPAVCILAGGLGTRLGDLVADTPKPLLKVAGRPFLLHQLHQLAAADVSKVVLCVGYHGRMIEKCVGNRQFGIPIEYSYDEPGLSGTLGAIRRAVQLLPDRFLVLYGDTYLRVDHAAVYAAWLASGRLGLMTVLRNEGRWDVSNAVYEDGRVVAYDKAHPTPEMQWIDYGLGGLDRRALQLVDPMESDLPLLYARLAALQELFGYEVHERFYEIGTPEGLAEAERFLSVLRG